MVATCAVHEVPLGLAISSSGEDLLAHDISNHDDGAGLNLVELDLEECFSRGENWFLSANPDPVTVLTYFFYSCFVIWEFYLLLIRILELKLESSPELGEPRLDLLLQSLVTQLQSHNPLNKFLHHLDNLLVAGFLLDEREPNNFLLVPEYNSHLECSLPDQFHHSFLYGVAHQTQKRLRCITD